MGTRKRDGPPRRRRDGGTDDDRLGELEEWRESFTSHTIDVEGAIMERFGSLQMENDEMAAEMRGMKRQIREIANAGPVYVAPVVPGGVGTERIIVRTPSEGEKTRVMRMVLANIWKQGVQIEVSKTFACPKCGTKYIPLIK